MMTEPYRGLEAFDEVERLIVVCAHPDDLETMCGGTMALLARRGVRIFLVNCTLGDIGAQDASISRTELASTRIGETEEAARILGLEESFVLEHHDGELVPDLALRAELARLFRLTQADTLCTFDPFWPGQIHPDHRAAGLAAIDAYMPSKMPLYRPEQLNEVGAAPARLERVFLFSTERGPDVFVDVGEIYETKLVACLAHVSQFPEGEESLEWMKERDRTAGEKIGVEYAEPLLQLAVW